ncbi:O-methyltransferase- family 2 [Apiospora arundinis]
MNKSKDDESTTWRLEYREYDFFTEQVVHGANVHMPRTVLHEWPNKQAIQTLRNQVPALKPWARILVNDMCIEDQIRGETPGHSQLKMQSQSQCDRLDGQDGFESLGEDS